MTSNKTEKQTQQTQNTSAKNDSSTIIMKQPGQEQPQPKQAKTAEQSKTNGLNDLFVFI